MFKRVRLSGVTYLKREIGLTNHSIPEGVNFSTSGTRFGKICVRSLNTL